MRSLACLFARGANPLSSFTTNVSRILFLCVLLLGGVAASGQSYTYGTESFSSGWPSTAPASETSIAATTGAWLNKGNGTTTTSSLTYGGTGTSILMVNNSSVANYIISPQLTSGASSINLYSRSSSTTARTITVYTSTTNAVSTSFTSVGTITTGLSSGAYLNGSFTFTNGANIKYIRLAILSSGTAYVDDITIAGVATNYYNKANTDITDRLNWGTATDGTGSNPADFTTSQQVFNLTNPTSNSNVLPSAWTVSGTSSKVVVGGGSSYSFTIPAASSYTGTVDVSASATITVTNATVPTIGTCATTSSVVLNNPTSAQTIPAASFGNLTIDNAVGATLGGAITTNGALTINSGAILDASSTGNYSITAKGNWVNNGTFNAQAGTVTFGGTSTISGSSSNQFKNVSISASSTLTGPASGTINVSGNWANAGTFTPSTSTVVFNGTSTISGATSSTFNNVTISGTLTGPSSGTWSIAGNLVNNGTFTSNTSTTAFNGSANQTISGTSTTAFGSITLNNTGTSPTNNIVDFQSVFTGTNNGLTLTAGIMKISSASSYTPFTGNSTVTSGNGFIIDNSGATLTQSGSSMTLNGILKITSNGGTVSIGNTNNSLTIGSTGALTLSGGTLNIKGRFLAIAAGTTTINGGSLIVPTGGTVSTASNSIIQIGNSAIFSMTSGAITVRSKNGNATLPDISIAQSSNTITGGTITVSDATITVNCNIPVYDFVVDNNAGTATASLSAALSVLHNLTINSGTLLANSKDITVGGNWTNAGTYTPGTNTVTFTGGSAQHQYTRTGTGSFSSLTLNDANGLLLNNDLTAAGTLTLTNGKVTLGSNNLTLGAAVSGPGALGSTTSNYVVTNGSGKLIIQTIGTAVLGDVLFPVGNTSYNPLVINTAGMTVANTFGVSVSNSTVGGAIAAESVNRSWIMSHSSGTDAAIVKVQWTAADENGSFTRGSSQLVNSNGSSFTDQGSIAAASGSDPYTQTSAIAFSNFTTIGVIKGIVITQFYNVAGSDISNVANWGTNTDGSGTTPTDFVTDYQVFNISNSGATMSSPWTVSGTTSAINVGDGTGAVTFTQTQDITGTVNVKNNATLQISNDNIPTFGTIATGSTVEYAGNTQSITAANYYNLKLSGSGSRNFPSGTVAVAGAFIPGSFTSASAGTVSFNGTAQAIPVFNYNNLTLAGTGTTFPVGIVGIGGAFTNGSISSASQGTISYNGSVAQSLTAFNYNNLTLAGSGTRSFPTGTVGIAGAFVPTTFTTATQGTISYNGTSAQTVAGFNYAALSCNNSAGTSIGAGNTASITSLTIPAGKLTVNGTLENVNTGATVITSTATNLEFSSTGTYKLSAAPGAASGATQIPTATWTDSSTLYLALGTSATGDYNNLQGVKQTFSNVVVNNGAFAGKLVLPFNTNGGNTAPFLIISGRLSVLSTGVGTSSLQMINSGKNNNALAMNSYQQTSGTVYVAGSTSSANNRVVTVAGDVYIDGGTFYVLNANGGSSTNIGALNIGGNLVLASGATMIKDGTAAAVGNLQFNSTTANQTFTNNGTFTGPINVNINNTFGRVNLAGNLAISGSLALTAGTFDIDVNTLTLQGTTTRTAGAIDADNGLLVLNGTSAQTLPASAIAGGSIKSLTVNNGAGATLTGNHTIGNTLTLTSGALAMSTGTTLTMGTNSDIIRIAGSLSATPVFNSQVDVRYQNVGTLTTGNELPANEPNIKSLMIETGGSNPVSLGHPVVINGDLTLTSGKLVLGANDLSVSTITQNSTSSWVTTDGAGALKVVNMAASTTQLFPVGASTSSYSPLSVAPAAASQDWSVRVASGIQPSTGVWYSNDAVQRTWNVTPYTSGTSTALPTATAEMTFQWDVSNTGMLTANSAWNGNSATAIVNHYTGTNWETAGGTLTAGDANPVYTLKLAYSGSFSPFAISKSTMPLPVTLLSFTGKRMNGANELKWITATESGNRGFALERSIDGRSYTQVGFVVTRAQGGNSSSELAYSFRDNAAGTKWYYRLKQTDIDGKSKYSNVVTLSSDKSGMLVLDGVYPNPAKNNIQVRMQAAANSNGLVLQLSDMQGRIVKLKQVSLEAGASTTVSMELTGLAAGVYHLKAVSSDGTVSETTTLVKQ
jgi:hypothetical protein